LLETAAQPPRATSSIESRSLLAGLLQGMGQRDDDKEMLEAGKRLAKSQEG